VNARVAAIVVFAVVVNLGLLLLMERMVARDRVRPVNLYEAQTIDFVRTKQDDQERTKDRRKKPPPKPQETKKPKARMDNLLAQTMELPTPVDALDIKNMLGVGGVAIGGRLVDGVAGPGDLTLQESDLTPVSKLPPQYPPLAQMRGMEGVVELKLLVLEDGTVGEVEVVRADHGKVFIKSAVAAASRWRYRPLIRDGVAVPVRVIVSVEYELE
jgi:protein TonB